MPTSSGPSYTFSGGEELQRQIELLKFYPEIFDKHFYPAMERSAELVKEGIRPLLPEHTGKLIRALGSRVIHSGTAALGTRAEIGFGKRYGKPSAPYAAALNQGSVAHEVAGGTRIKSPADGNLHFSSKGRFTSIGSVHIPQIAGLHFAEGGLEQARPAIDAEIDQAAGAVVQELAS
jgi:hypothetical protein